MSIARNDVEQLVKRRVDPTSDAMWRRLVDTQRTDVFHSPAWCAVLADTYGFELAADVLVDPAGEPVAGLVFAELSDLAGRRRVSLPFSDFCDPVVTTATQWQALTDELDGDGPPLHLRCLRSDVPLQDRRFGVRGRAHWHVVELRQDLERQWASIDPRARRSIRQARGAGVEVRPAEDLAELRRFHELHVRVRKHKYGLLAQPFRFFERIWDHLLSRDNGVLLLAHEGGEVVGGVMYLQWGDTLYYKFNASDSARLHVRPNDLLAWSGIEQAIGRGLKRLDFGLTDWDQDTLARYKRKYATSSAVIHALRSELPEPPPQEVQWRSDLRRLTELLVDERVPDDLTASAGDALYRYFA